MWKSLFFVCFLAASGVASSQDAPSSSGTHELGVNATLLIKNFLAFNDIELVGSPYVFTYRYIRGNTALRAGLAYDYSISKPEPDIFTVTSSNSELAFRVGVEKRREVGNRWMFFGGIDGFVSRTSFLTKASGDFDNTSVSDVTSSVGVAPLMGLQFRLSKQVSLQTEASLPISVGSAVHKEESENFPDINAESKNSVLTIQSIFPTSLFIVIEL